MQMNMLNRDSVQRSSIELQKAGQELANGKPSDIYEELGSKSAYLLNLRIREDNTQAFMTTGSVLENKLQAMLTSIDTVRDLVDDVLQSALVNETRPILGASSLQIEARAALESVIAHTNISFNGDFLFSGIDSDGAPLAGWAEVNATTGFSPETAMQSIIGSGPTTLTEVQQMTAAIDAVFASNDTTNPARNYEGTFYNGTPALDSAGQDNTRVTALVNEGFTVEYGVQANDPMFKNILKGLAILATSDVSDIQDPEAYEAWMAEAVNALGTGLNEALGTSATIGFNQQILETTQRSLDAISLVQRTQISDYESVDPYEAATRLTSLETQLQASYSVSARLSRLTILSHF